MSNPPKPTANSHQKTQHAGSHPHLQPADLTIQVGPSTTENDTLNAIATHIFAPEMRREAQRAPLSQVSGNSDAPPSGSGNVVNQSIPRTLARLVRPFNRRSSSKLGKTGQPANPNLDDPTQGSHLRFIEDVRNALPNDIDNTVVQFLGQDALRVFSRDTFPHDLVASLQRQEGSSSHELYTTFIDLLGAEARSYAFSQVPIRVIKLPEIVFLEREGLADDLLNKLRKQPTQIFAEISVDDIREFLYNNPSVIPLCQSTTARWLKKEARYIILSHTWEGDELTYKSFFDSEQRTRCSRSYNKLKTFCTIAHEEFGAGYAWADTVCIDKTSSAELDESIRSMFAWYHNSHVCLIYLARTLSLRDLAADRWFTRGWTLQELLAPRHVKFYTQNWQPLTHLPNDKKALGRRPEQPPARSHAELAQMILYNIKNDTSHLVDADLDAATREEIAQLESAISRATGISMNEIIDFKPGFSAGLAKRMRWIARRNTTRAEDKSYCMMGIFGVSMSIAYGEGPDRAFFRLFETILKVSSSPDLFLWAGKPVNRSIHASSMIPSSPECFAQGVLPFPASEFEWDGQRSILPPRDPITLTNVGLCISVLAIPEIQPCSYEDAGRASAKTLRLKTPLSDEVIKVILLTDEWLSFRVYNDGSQTLLGVFAFGVCNFTARPEGSAPRVPRRVWAILMYRRDAREQWRRLLTQDVVTFECAERLRYKELQPCYVVKEWTGSAVGSSWKLPETPEMMLQTLYL